MEGNQTHLKESVPVAGEQSVRLWLVLAVQGIHSKLILLHTRLTSYNTDYSEKYPHLSADLTKHYERFSSHDINVIQCVNVRFNDLLICHFQQ